MKNHEFQQYVYRYNINNSTICISTQTATEFCFIYFWFEIHPNIFFALEASELLIFSVDKSAIGKNIQMFVVAAAAASAVAIYFCLFLIVELKIITHRWVCIRNTFVQLSRTIINIIIINSRSVLNNESQILLHTILHRYNTQQSLLLFVVVVVVVIAIIIRRKKKKFTFWMTSDRVCNEWAMPAPLPVNCILSLHLKL